MRIVMRNQIIHKDAVYVVEWDAYSGPIKGYWGPWEAYQKRGLSGLRSQVKGSGYASVAKLLHEKLRKGYDVIGVQQVPESIMALLRSYGPVFVSPSASQSSPSGSSTPATQPAAPEAVPEAAPAVPPEVLDVEAQPVALVQTSRRKSRAAALEI